MGISKEKYIQFQVYMVANYRYEHRNIYEPSQNYQMCLTALEAKKIVDEILTVNDIDFRTLQDSEIKPTPEPRGGL